MGYLIRVAGELEYPTPAYITAMAGVVRALVNTEDSIKRLAFCLRQDEEALRTHFYPRVPKIRRTTQHHFFGHSIDAILLNCTRFRVCPQCLREQSVARAVWDLNLVNVCPRHECDLITHCPSCRRRLSWRRAPVHLCGCGYDLRRKTSKQAPDGSIALTAMIYRSIGENHGQESRIERSGYPEGLKNLSLPDLLRVIRLFGVTFFHMADGLRMLRVPNVKRGTSGSVIETANRLFANWPTPFVEQLIQVQKKYKVKDILERKIDEAFGHFYLQLLTHFSGSEFQFIHDAFEEYAVANWEGLGTRNCRWFRDKARANHPWITALEVTRIFPGLRGSVVLNLVRDGIVNGFIRKSASGKVLKVWVERASLSEWMEEGKKWISVFQAMATLGLDRTAVMGLCSANVLRYKRGGVAGRLSVQWNFSREDVEKLSQTFRSLDVPEVEYAITDENFISLRQARFKFLGANEGLARAICAVVDGRLTPVGRIAASFGLSDYIFRTGEIKVFIPLGTGLEQEKYLNQSEVARALCVRKAVVPALIRHKLLPAPIRPANGRKAKLIPQGVVDQFHRRFVYQTELVGSFHLEAQWLRRCLKSYGVVGIPIIISQSERGTLYKRDELVGIKIARRDLPEKHKKILIRVSRAGRGPVE